MPDVAIQYTEEMVGANHPTKADTLNRGIAVEHSLVDGSHDATKVGMLAGAQIFTGEKEFSGGLKLTKGADIASAATITIPATGSLFDVTGSVGISAIATKGIGTRVFLKFLSTVVLTHSATFWLPQEQNFTAQVGDVLEFYEFALGSWIVIGGNKSGVSIVSSEIVKSANQTLTAAALTWEDVTELQVTLPDIGTYDIEYWLRVDTVTDSAASTGTADLAARLYNITGAAVVVNSQVFLLRADRHSNGLTIYRANTTYGKHSVTTTQINEVIKVQVLEIDVGVTFLTKKIASNTTGRSKLRYTKVG